MVLTARPGGDAGVKVATNPAESRETVPDTLPPAEDRVNVVAGELIVAGFIALLNVALITVGLGEQTRVEPSAGFTVVTVGAVKGAPGFPAPGILSASPQPAIRTANRNAGIQILRTFNLRISFSSSPCCKAFHTAHTRSGIYGTSNFTGCSIQDKTHQRPDSYSNFYILPSVQY